MKYVREKVLKAIDGIGKKQKIFHDTYKSAKKAYLFSRELAIKCRSSKHEYPVNIFHASIQRTGSQWIRNVFSDNRVSKYTGLRTFPQHEYEIHEHRLRFPKYTFVPGLYIPYEAYVRIKKFTPFRTFYIIRDPREIICSWVKSMKHSHRPINPSVNYYRNKLTSKSLKESLLWGIKVISIKLQYMKDWVLNAEEDPNVSVFRFENLVEKPVDTFLSIFRHCKIEIPRDSLKSILTDYSKKKMREKHNRTRQTVNKRYVTERNSWRDVFDEHHKELFSKVNGKLVQILGY
ncbi:sulfotransferase domain-containing protein [Salinibacter ruber]|uniref:sulfotransferase domain-containing protein n=1 Tax=Salinibacter ruber TaxID=146919 RepID=UPI000E56E92A